MFELHDFRIIGVFYKSLLSKGPTDPFDLNDFLNSDYMGSTVVTPLELMLKGPSVLFEFGQSSRYRVFEISRVGCIFNGIFYHI